MNVGSVKETFPGEKRVAITPAVAGRLIKKGAQVMVEKDIGASIYASDEQYTASGANVISRERILAEADIVLGVRKPMTKEIPQMKKGAISISFLDPFKENDLIVTLARHGISAISLEMIPRTTIAQKMDALSSQANLAGYVAVIMAAERISKILPMMSTPAGTISPARVFVIGVGVAGLQAIATAKRLGARVEAFDTRPVVKEQVQSLGAKFVEVDLGETGQTKDGYAKSLTPEQLALQRDAMAKVCAQSDIIITTAQIFGRRAPLILTRDMIASMKPGTIVVDLAVESGGNVEGVELDREVNINGVNIVGLGNLPSRAAINASDMLAANFANFIEHFWNKETKNFELRTDDEIIKNCLVTHNGKIINEKIQPKA